MLETATEEGSAPDPARPMAIRRLPACRCSLALTKAGPHRRESHSSREGVPARSDVQAQHAEAGSRRSPESAAPLLHPGQQRSSITISGTVSASASSAGRKRPLAFSAISTVGVYASMPWVSSERFPRSCPIRKRGDPPAARLQNTCLLDGLDEYDGTQLEDGNRADAEIAI